MKIVSFIRESFMEYEDYVSLVLFSYGCNMRCSYCYNYDHIMDSDAIIDSDVNSIIDENVTPLTDALVFLGGEPTIYGARILEASTYAKLKHDLSVKVFSNGTRHLLLLDGLLSGLFDSVSVDFKAIEETPIIQYNRASWSSYVSGVTSFLDTVNRNGMNDRVEVRNTSVSGMERDVYSIKDICDNYGIRFIQQRDVRSSYGEIGLLPKVDSHLAIAI